MRSSPYEVFVNKIGTLFSLPAAADGDDRYLIGFLPASLCECYRGRRRAIGREEQLGVSAG
jgi:hypothetical protein